MSLMLTEMSYVTCEHPSVRVPSQTPMPNLYCYIAKLACVKAKLRSIIVLILTKK